MTNIIMAAVALVMATESPHGVLRGDGGRAFGPAQIHAERLADITRRHPGLGLRMTQMADRRTAAAVVYLELRDIQARRHYRNAVALASTWRVPYGRDAAWHVKRLRKANASGEGRP